MNKQYIEKMKFGNWYKELNNTYSLMLSDDIDSHFTATFLKDKFDCNVDIFNNFNQMYKSENFCLSGAKKEKIIGVDLDLSKHRCFANHVSYLQNKDCISLNRGIAGGCSDYYNKFAGSTLLTVFSLYDLDLSNCTTEQLEVLISVDTAFKQYYFNEELFEKYYNDILEYPVFIDIVASKGKDYFYNIIKEYKLHEKIIINDEGYLETKIELEKLSQLFNIDLSLPTDQFFKFYGMQTVGMDERSFQREFRDNTKVIFSSAYTGRDYIVASVKY